MATPKYLLDVTGTNIADNCRHAIALPNGRTALLGSGGPPNATSDAYMVILDDTGKPDPAFGSGILKYELGGNDAFFSGALSADRKHLLAAGFKGGGETPSAAVNDDAHVVSFAIEITTSGSVLEHLDDRVDRIGTPSSPTERHNRARRARGSTQRKYLEFTMRAIREAQRANLWRV